MNVCQWWKSKLWIPLHTSCIVPAWLWIRPVLLCLRCRADRVLSQSLFVADMHLQLWGHGAQRNYAVIGFEHFCQLTILNVLSAILNCTQYEDLINSPEHIEVLKLIFLPLQHPKRRFDTVLAAHGFDVHHHSAAWQTHHDSWRVHQHCAFWTFYLLCSLISMFVFNVWMKWFL